MSAQAVVPSARKTDTPMPPGHLLPIPQDLLTDAEPASPVHGMHGVRENEAFSTLAACPARRACTGCPACCSRSVLPANRVRARSARLGCGQNSASRRFHRLLSFDEDHLRFVSSQLRLHAPPLVDSRTTEPPLPASSPHLTSGRGREVLEKIELALCQNRHIVKVWTKTTSPWSGCTARSRLHPSRLKRGARLAICCAGCKGASRSGCPILDR